jgi:hypothetical protein
LSDSDDEQVTDESGQQNVGHEENERQEKVERHKESADHEETVLETESRKPLLPAEPEQILNARLDGPILFVIDGNQNVWVLRM